MRNVVLSHPTPPTPPKGYQAHLRWQLKRYMNGRYSVKDLASKSGVSSGVISSFLTGNRTIGKPSLSKLVGAGVNLDLNAAIQSEHN